MHRISRLDNGLRVITDNMADMKSVSVGVWIKTGGRYENKEYKGISHYLEHLLFKGTKKYSCRKLKESIEGAGGGLNGWTSEELTCYLVKLPRKYIDLGLNILSDMVIDPLLPQLEVEKERTVILEELKMYRDQPQTHVHELLDNLLWPEQILGMSIIGTAESINAVKRSDLYSYKTNYYTPANMVISAAGAVDHKRFVRNVDTLFAQSRNSGPYPFEKAKQEQQKPQLHFLRKDTEQTHIALGFHGFRRDDPMRYAQGILHIILGANMSSRLFNEVREKKGLAYEIGTSIKRFYDTGAFIVQAGIDNHKVTEAIEVILQELWKIKNKLITKDEFTRAKEFYLGQLELALEDTMDNMLWIGESVATLDKAYTVEEIIGDVRRLKREDIKNTARQIFAENKINLAVIGPGKDEEPHIYSRLKV